MKKTKKKNKILIAYYSRTGMTKKVALTLAEQIGADVEEIISVKDRKGVLGYLFSSKEAITKKLALIEKTKYDVKDYNTIIIGTPVWDWTMASPVRTYLLNNKKSFKNIAIITTEKTSGSIQTIKNIQRLIDKKSIANLTLKTKEVINNNYLEKLENFVLKINK